MNRLTKLSVNQKKVLSLFEAKSIVTVAMVVAAFRVPRPTVKQTLSRLEQWHFIEQFGSGRGAYYRLRNEDIILDQFGNETVKVFKGLDGFKLLFKQLEKQLSKNDYYYAFAFKNEYANEDVRKLLIDFHTRLSVKEINDKAIAHNSQKDVLTKVYKDIKNLKLKFTELDLPTGVIIVDGAVIQLVWGEHPIAFMIINPIVHKYYKSFFELMWR